MHILHVLAVELDDHIAGWIRAVVDRTALDHAGDEGAFGGGHAEAFGDLVGDRLDANAEPAAAGLAELLELIDDVDGKLRGDREADADRAAGGRDDGRVDADHLAIHVEQRPARIAAVDRGVGLDEVVVGTRH